MYTVRRSWDLPQMIVPDGLGAFHRYFNPGSHGGLGQGHGDTGHGGGQGVDTGGGGGGGEAGCEQQVSTAERDRLRSASEAITKNYFGQRPFGQHWHEGHPDIKAYLADIIPRMEGLTNRPKLMRCNAEARKRAVTWTASVKDLLGRVKASAGYTVVNTPFDMSFYRGPTYRIRSTTDPVVNAAMRGEKKAPPVETLDCPSGWVKVAGKCFETSKDAERQTDPQGTGEGYVVDPLLPGEGGYPPAGGNGGGLPFLGGGGGETIAGIPMTLIYLGVGAFVLTRVMK